MDPASQPVSQFNAILHTADAVEMKKDRVNDDVQESRVEWGGEDIARDQKRRGRKNKPRNQETSRQVKN